MSRIKEPNFFSRVVIADDHPMVKPIRDEKRYLRLFEGAGDAKVVGEASPTYFEDPEAPHLINRTVPGAKILVSLRDPVQRLHSHYLMMRNNRPSMGSFREEIERGIASQDTRRMAVLAPATGLYSRHIERYQLVFGDKRFKILVFEEWRADVPRSLRQILEFLGIDHELDDVALPAQRQYAEARGPIVRYLFGNRAISRATESLIPFRLRKMVRNALLVKQAPKPDMDPEDREFLVRYYLDDVRQVEEMLGRRPPWRNFASALQSRNVG